MVNGGKSGFSLIEVMVATAILVIIVLIMSQIFHQSQVAWDGGMRKAEGNMTARAALGLMARELRAAVADGNIWLSRPEEPWYVLGQHGGYIKFVTLTWDPNVEKRIARRIKYELIGGEIIRTVERSKPGDYGAWTQDGSPSAIAEGVKELKFVPSFSSGESLPNWVRIEMSVMRTDDVSGVGAESAGPNGTFGDGDDIRSF